MDKPKRRRSDKLRIAADFIWPDRRLRRVLGEVSDELMKIAESLHDEARRLEQERSKDLTEA